MAIYFFCLFVCSMFLTVQFRNRVMVRLRHILLYIIVIYSTRTTFEFYSSRHRCIYFCVFCPNCNYPGLFCWKSYLVIRFNQLSETCHRTWNGTKRMLTNLFVLFVSVISASALACWMMLTRMIILCSMLRNNIDDLTYSSKYSK